MRSQQDLTQGSIRGSLVGYFLPIAAGTLFQQLYNSVDAIIVGKFVGTEALAAVGGSAANIINLIIGLFVALSGGAAIIIAQLFGAREEELLPSATGTAVTFSVAAGLFLTVAGVLLAPNMLMWMKAPADTLADASLYLRIYFGGAVFVLLYNMEAGILRAVGDSRSPFIYLLVGCGANIVMDLLFVAVLGWGVAGVAIATVAAQVLSVIMATAKLFRSQGSYRLDLHQLRLRPALLRRMMRLGIPAGLQSAMYGVSNLILQVSINLLGTTVVASWSLSGKVDGFYWAVTGAAGTAVMNFAGQNYGARRLDRVHACRKVSLRLFIVITVAFSALLLSVGRLVLPIFTDDAAVIDTTWYIIKAFVPFYFLWTVIEVYSGVLRGVGDAVPPVVITGLGICLMRVVWVLTAYRAVPTLGCVCICYPLSWLITDVALIIHYHRGRWEKKSA